MDPDLYQPLDFDSQVRQQMAMMGVSNFSWWGLLWALIFGILGARFFVRGKKTGDMKVLWTGVVMMVYPMFSVNPWFVAVTGFALTAFAIYTERNG